MQELQRRIPMSAVYGSPKIAGTMPGLPKNTSAIATVAK